MSYSIITTIQNTNVKHARLVIDHITAFRRFMSPAMLSLCQFVATETFRAEINMEGGGQTHHWPTHKEATEGF
jgi:hypothetical protein